MTEPPMHSGSRWEPIPADPSDTTPPVRPAEQVAVDADPVTATLRPRLQRWSGRWRRALLAAAAAVGPVAAAGTGGFAIGHEVGQGRPGGTYGGPGGASTGSSSDGTGRQTAYVVPAGGATESVR